MPIYCPTRIVGEFVVDPCPRNWSHSLKAPRATDERKAAHAETARTEETPGTRAMNAQELLQEISDYCRQTGLAESTFGRRAVNDGKLASRLRHGGRITTETLDRIRSFMATNRNAGARPAVIARAQPALARHARPKPLQHRGRWRRSQRCPHPSHRLRIAAATAPTAPIRSATSASSTTGRSICCSSTPAREKWVVANRVSLELAQHPSAAAGAAPVRRRRRRRHRAAARDARDARPLPAHAVLRRRQGDQPRGRPARDAEDVGPLHPSIRRPCWC